MLSRALALALVLASLAVVSVSAQSSASAAPQAAATAPTAAASIAPADVASPDAIIAAAYAAISGPAGQVRDEARIKAIFLPEARFVVGSPKPDGSFTPHVYDLDAFIAGMQAFVQKDGFFERGILNREERYGNIAHVFSSYESRHDAKDPKPFARGVNSFQLLNDGKRWWILSVYWEQESPSAPIPERYLKKD